MHILRRRFIYILTTGILFILVFEVSAQDQINGKYWSPKKDGKFEIFQRGGYYFGKIIWSEHPVNDIKNPDAKLRDRPVVGMEFLKKFKYNGKDTWEDGTIYDAHDGKTYNCYMSLDTHNNLKVRGYIGIALIGRTEIMERIKE